MSVCVTLFVCVFLCERYVCVCEWRGEFYRVVLVVQLGLIFDFILNPEQRRVFQLVIYITEPIHFLSSEMFKGGNFCCFVSTA
jgi:hypothetical protein